MKFYKQWKLSILLTMSLLNQNFLLLSSLFLLEKHTENITVNEYNIVDVTLKCDMTLYNSIIFAPLLIDSIHLYTCISHIAMITNNEIKIYQRSKIGSVALLNATLYVGQCSFVLFKYWFLTHIFK